MDLVSGSVATHLMRDRNFAGPNRLRRLRNVGTRQASRDASEPMPTCGVRFNTAVFPDESIGLETIVVEGNEWRNARLSTLRPLSLLPAIAVSTQGDKWGVTHGFRSRRVRRWFRRTGSGWIRIGSRGPDCHQGLSHNAAGKRSRCIATTGRVTDSELPREPDEPEGCSFEEDEEGTPAERSRFAEKLKKIDPAAFEATSGSSGRSPSTAGFSGGDHDRVRVGVARFRRPGLQDDQGLPLRLARTGRVCGKPVAGRCCAARAARWSAPRALHRHHFSRAAGRPRRAGRAFAHQDGHAEGVRHPLCPSGRRSREPTRSGPVGGHSCAAAGGAA